MQRGAESACIGAQPFDPRAYWEERLRANTGLRGVGYTSLGEGYNRWMYRLREKVFCRAASEIGATWPEVSVLDIGSGTGFYLRLWERFGVKRIDGIDLTATAVCRLRSSFPRSRFFQRDIGNPQFVPLPTTYQLISAFDILFHIVDDQRYVAALRNVHAALDVGGLFLFSDAFLHSGTLRAEHVVFRSLEDVEEILKRTGFAIVERRPVFVFMNQPVDTESRVLQFAWKVFERALGFSETIGQTAGACLYPLDRLCTAWMKESPTTELMVCRKTGPAA